MNQPLQNRSFQDLPKASLKIIRLPTVKNLTGCSRSTIYLRIAKGLFPKPISLGGRAVGWIEAEVINWIEERIQSSRDDGMRSIK